MRKILTILSLAILLASCGSKKTSAEKNGNTISRSSDTSKKIKLGKSEMLTYESLGNGVASISLHMYENNTFKFNFKTVAEPEEGQEPIKIYEVGTYETQGDWTTLSFYNPKASLEPIFDSTYGNKNDYKVVDPKTVKINTSKNSISIWGIVCEKK